MPDVTADGKEVLTSVPGFRGLGLWLLSLAFFRVRGGWSMWQRARYHFLGGWEAEYQRRTPQAIVSWVLMSSN